MRASGRRRRRRGFIFLFICGQGAIQSVSVKISIFVINLKRLDAQRVPRRVYRQHYRARCGSTSVLVLSFIHIVYWNSYVFV